MVRLYGNSPYKAILIHGGPGAAGSLKTCAEELSEVSGIGVVEALQSKYSIDELTEELCAQAIENCKDRAVLIGHSWGAWLAVLFAEKYPKLCKSVILVGCPPLTDEYVKEINLRRIKKMSENEKRIFHTLTDNTATDQEMRMIPQILEKTDNYCLEDSGIKSEDAADSQMYHSVWREAAEMRTEGELLTAFRKVKCKIILIQGAADPHPETGVTEPLKKAGIEYEFYSLDQCGHSPFLEKYAKDKFYQILSDVIRKAN